MKKIGLILLLCSLSVSLFAYDLGQVEDSFQKFAEETTAALPFSANMGLNWNDAFIGKFPHFGVGLTTGAVFLPSEAFEDMYALTGNTSLSNFSKFGIPLPMYSLDGRLGLPILPFDIGIKFGILNPDMLPISDDYSIGYKMIGADVRWGLLKEKFLIPALSVGVGYTWLSGNMIVPIADQTVDIAATGAGTNLTLSDSNMNYEWSSNMLDFKVQLSKKILLLNLSAGAGYSYGISSAGGGISSGTVNVDGNPISATEIAQIESATGMSIDNEGVSVLAKNNGGTPRVFGGVGLNLFLFKLDLGVLYGIQSKTMGLTANARVQF